MFQPPMAGWIEPRTRQQFTASQQGREHRNILALRPELYRSPKEEEGQEQEEEGEREEEVDDEFIQ